MKPHAPRLSAPFHPLAALSRVAVAVGLATASTAALAQSAFVAPESDFKGQVSASSATQGAPILAGGEVTFNGRGFKPGQEVTLARGSTVLNPGAPYVAGADGTFKANFKLPADAAVGRHPIIVNAAKPSAAAVFELKVSPHVPLSGADKYEMAHQKLEPGLYQVAYSPKREALFVTAAGREGSTLMKVDPKTLAIVAKQTPPQAPASAQPQARPAPAAQPGQQAQQAPRPPAVMGVYGIGLDEENATVWTTNTRQNTVAVYKQSDLSLVKQFDPGPAPHSRDVVIDSARGKAYVSGNKLVTFNTRDLSVGKEIEIRSTRRGSNWGIGSLALDAANGKLYVLSMPTDELAVIDTATDAVEKVIPLAGVKSTFGLALDPAHKRAFVVSQGSDSFSIVDLERGEVVKTVLVGAGALNVTFDPVKRLAYVSNRGAGTITVLNDAGDIVANLDGGAQPNHGTTDGKGNIYLVNKGRGDDERADRILRLTAR